MPHALGVSLRHRPPDESENLRADASFRPATAERDDRLDQPALRVRRCSPIVVLLLRE